MLPKFHKQSQREQPEVVPSDPSALKGEQGAGDPLKH